MKISANASYKQQPKIDPITEEPIRKYHPIIEERIEALVDNAGKGSRNIKKAASRALTHLSNQKGRLHTKDFFLLKNR